MGEDVGARGGVFLATDGFLAEFGEARVIDTPLAESSIAGIAVGAAVNGMRPRCSPVLSAGAGRKGLQARQGETRRITQTRVRSRVRGGLWRNESRQPTVRSYR